MIEVMHLSMLDTYADLSVLDMFDTLCQFATAAETICFSLLVQRVSP